MLLGIERLLAGLVGFLVGLAIYSRVGEYVTAGRDDRGILVLVIALPAALIGGAAYAAYAEESWGRRGLLVHGLGLLFFWLGFVAPLQRDRQAAERRAQAEARREAARAILARATPTPAARPARDESKEARAAFLRELRESGAHGPAGMVPPMLGVMQDSSARITITNRGDTPVYVALARVKESPGSTPRWRGCDMDRLMSGGIYALIKPRETWFIDPGPLCPGDLREGTLEYRVGKIPGDTGWWSDSAFEAPDGRPPDPRRQ